MIDVHEKRRVAVRRNARGVRARIWTVIKQIVVLMDKNSASDEDVTFSVVGSEPSALPTVWK